MRALSIGALMLALFFMGGQRASAQQAAAVEAALTVGFLDLVSWPATPAEYTIGIDGDADMTALVQAVAGTVKGKVIHVKKVGDDFTGCQAVFVQDGDAVTLMPGVLTVGNGEAFISRGGIIGLAVRDGKVRLFISTENAGKAGLKINPRLLALSSS